MFTAIILGGGSGERAQLDINKVLYRIKGKTIIEHSAHFFIEDPDFTEVIIVINRDDYDQAKLLFNEEKVRVIKGGNTRQESVYLGLMDLKNNNYVLIHDGARPNVSKESIQKLKTAVKKSAAVLYTQANESLIIMKDSLVSSYLNRDSIGFIKTPQAFRISEILQAYQQAKLNHHQYKDDASLYKNELKKEVFLIEDLESNIKITTQIDIKLMEELL